MVNGIGATFSSSQNTQAKINIVRREDCKAEDIYDFNYNPHNDGLYPCRVNGEPKYLSPIGVGESSFGIPITMHGIKLDFKSAEKFFATDISSLERKSYYDNTLEVREFTENDRRYVWSLARQQAEVHLVGQLAVFAKVEISPGTCIGAYSGEVINDDNESEFTSEQINTYSTEFRICRNGERAKTVIVGDGALSRINGIFSHDHERGWYEEKSSVNVCFANVPAITNIGEDLLLPCVFAIASINPGEELRIEYGYSNKQVSKMMAGYNPKNNADKKD
ncbi:hypothetical protein N5923_19050 [Erwiniaceae bacterium BAC15a-03b]|uniref:SET domain-containing protein n=1 Tax=Winslowiella arboricola TaxID=2978220 RepID=A0A9J6PT35_9GAMM|nr:SET domain-containing protein-lysine N-methyltransferase [Winslowiella arboricola]MCU5775563.1 hypothetical protein [Winslowiella arboricola]MCU5779587.1 hypothetical protein [Winslowiella arboricola]